MTHYDYESPIVRQTRIKLVEFLTNILPISPRLEEDKKPCCIESGCVPVPCGGTPGGSGSDPGGHTPPPAHGKAPYGGGAAYKPYPAARANSAAARSAARFLNILLIEETLGAVALVHTPAEETSF